MKAVVAAFNQEKALVGAFSVITNFRMELFEALICSHLDVAGDGVGDKLHRRHQETAGQQQPGGHLVVKSEDDWRWL